MRWCGSPLFDEAGAALVLPAVPVLLRVQDVLSD